MSKRVKGTSVLAKREDVEVLLQALRRLDSMGGTPESRSAAALQLYRFAQNKSNGDVLNICNAIAGLANAVKEGTASDGSGLDSVGAVVLCATAVLLVPRAENSKGATVRKVDTIPAQNIVLKCLEEKLLHDPPVDSAFSLRLRDFTIATREFSGKLASK